MESLYDWCTSAQYTTCIFNETSLHDRGRLLAWLMMHYISTGYLRNLFMRVLLSFEVITNNDIELAFSHLWSEGIKEIPSVLMIDTGLLDTFKYSLYFSYLWRCKSDVCHLVVALNASLHGHIQYRGLANASYWLSMSQLRTHTHRSTH